MTQAEYIAELKEQRASAERQLGYFKKGMRVKFQGVDNTEMHVNALKKMVESYDKLLELLDA
jgi:hypothetical protein